jgi:hypothetical protein
VAVQRRDRGAPFTPALSIVSGVDIKLISPSPTWARMRAPTPTAAAEMLEPEPAGMAGAF